MSAKIYDVLVRMPENQKAKEDGIRYGPIMTVVGSKWNLWSLWAWCCNKQNHWELPCYIAKDRDKFDLQNKFKKKSLNSKMECFQAVIKQCNCWQDTSSRKLPGKTVLKVNKRPLPSGEWWLWKIGNTMLKNDNDAP